MDPTCKDQHSADTFWRARTLLCRTLFSSCLLQRRVWSTRLAAKTKVVAFCCRVLFSCWFSKQTRLFSWWHVKCFNEHDYSRKSVIMNSNIWMWHRAYDACSDARYLVSQHIESHHISNFKDFFQLRPRAATRWPNGLFLSDLAPSWPPSPSCIFEFHVSLLL